jgi:hypothetical protein
VEGLAGLSLVSVPRKFTRNQYLTAAIAIAIVIVVVVAISVSGSPKKKTSTAVKPISIVAGPAGIVSGTTPDNTGHSWVLVNLGNKANMQYINTSTGTNGGALPLSSSARVIAVATGGEIGVGLNGGSTGAVEFFSSQGSNKLGVVPLAGPVADLVAGSNGTSFYALQDVNGADSVTVIDAKTLKAIGTIPVPSTTLSIAISPDLTTIYSLQANGDISLADAQTGKVVQSLPLTAGARQLALSADGATLYVLKGSALDDNVSVVDVATESTVKVLPAPKDCEWIAPSLDGTQLVDFVGTPTLGNIQTFATHR